MKRNILAGVLTAIFLGLLQPACAFAGVPPPAVPSPGPATPATPAAVTQSPCQVIASGAASAASGHAAMAIMPSTRWQPYGGEVLFELTGVQNPLNLVNVYFAWPDTVNKGQSECHQSLRVRLLPAQASDDNNTYRFAALVPALDNGSWISGFDHWDSATAVPMANIFVSDTSAAPANPVYFQDTVGISTIKLAVIGALLCGVIVWAVLALWVRSLKLPGGAFLGIISTPNGVASLSQFQILIWTYVVGLGAVYVMMLSGYLIDIPDTTLGLLGITGAALVGSKIHANKDNATQSVTAPAATTGLTVLGTPTSSTVVLTWLAPAGTDQPFSYTIQKRPAGTSTWTTVAHDIAAPPYAVTNLAPAQKYEFQVFAINAGGAGPASVPAPAQTAAAPAQAGPAPDQVTALTALAATDGTVKLSWATLATPPESYTVQYRQEGTLPWVTYDGNVNSPVIIPGLNNNTAYQFQVFAKTGGISGTPSALASVLTATRKPKWSDLVMSGDANNEIDLSRLQMLIFTTITAIFTALTLINTGVIPDLPIGQLTLVGISNGVYLATKVTGSGQGKS